MYRIIPSSAAQRDLKKLPLQVRRVVFDKHLPKIAADPWTAGERLHGDLRGFWSYHLGHRPEYRILYTVEDKDKVVLIIFVGTRENAYEEARRRRM